MRRVSKVLLSLEQTQMLYPVKVIDTISPETQQAIITAVDTCESALFDTMKKSGLDFLNDYWHDLEFGYYFSRATNKTLSMTYRSLADAAIRQGLNEDTFRDIFHSDFSYYAYFSFMTTDDIIARNIIIPRFAKKWTDVYNLLYSQEYSPLDSYSETEKRSADDTDTKTYDITDGKTGENTDVLTLNTQTDENGKVGTSETTTRSVESDNNVYGFNSSSPVGDTTSTDTVSESVVGEADNNTRESTRLRTGTESKAIGINETLKKTGTETTKYGKDETVTRSGRREAGSDLLNKELSFRSKQILMDIILDDIISVTTSPLYL